MARFRVGVSLQCSEKTPLPLQQASTINSIVFVILTTTVVLLLSALRSAAQIGPTPGIQMFSTNDFGVDVATSSININVPIRSKAGAIPFTAKFVGNSQAYIYKNSQGNKVIGITALGTIGAGPHSTLPSYVDPTRVQGYNALTTTATCQQAAYTYSNWAVVDLTGAIHPFPSTGVNQFNWSVPCSVPGAVTTTDGSGYTLVPLTVGRDGSGNATATFSVYDKSGLHWSGTCLAGGGCGTGISVSNPDGNMISAQSNGGTTSVTDTLNATAMTVGPTYTYSYTTPVGTSDYTLVYTNLNIKTNFGCTGVTDLNFGSYPVLTSITLPTNQGQYTFSYEPTPGNSGYYTGRIAKITFPSGGSVSYAYSGGNNGLYCGSLVVPTLTVTVADNNGNNNSSYTYVNSNTNSPSANYTVVKTDPAGNQTLYGFVGELQKQVAVYQGGCPTSSTGCTSGGVLLKTTTTCYGGNGSAPPTPPSCTGTINGPASPITETDVYTSLNSSSLTSIVKTTYNATYGNVTSVLSYDFGANLPTAQTFLFYGQSWNGSSCSAYPSGTYINSTPCYQHTENASGSDVAATKITYSNTGDPTSISRWVSGSNWLTSSMGYGANGASPGILSSSTDVNGATTTFSNFACNGMFPETTTLPQLPTESFQMSTFQTWNCDGGVVTSSQDANGNTTTYSHNDPLWRLTETVFPDSPSDTRTVSYNTGTNFPWQVTTTQASDSTHSVSVIDDLDGLGRTYAVYTTDPDSDDGEGYSRVWTVYNNLGQVYSVTNPYYQTSDPTYGVTSYAYDALGRVTQVTNPDSSNQSYIYSARATESVDENSYKKVFQTDGLGRLISVCEVTSQTQQGSSGTPSGCNQDISLTGFQTSYSYDPLGNLLSVAQPGVGSRTYQYDGLSRVTQEVNPESGTTTYTYDAAGQIGDLYQRTRPAPNQTATNCPTNCVTTTYTYDALHRLTSKTYTEPSYTVIPTPQVGFGYDESNVWGSVPTNYKGRLTHTSNQGGASFFSYDPMGRMTYGFQCDPFDCGSAAVLYWYTYNYLGVPTSEKMGDNVTENGYVTYTHTLDANGRVTQETSTYADQNHPATLYTVTSPHGYNALGQVVSDQLGNGIGRTFSYDNRGRFTNEVDMLGSTEVYGTQAWYQSNSNVGGTSTTNEGTWEFSYDNFNRLSTACQPSATCVGTPSTATAAYSYAYDPAGNRWTQTIPSTCSGCSGPQPQYNFNSKNQITNSGFVYDAVGNVIQDGPLSQGGNTYTYDAENRMITANSTSQSYFYDAIGRLTQTVYGGNTYSRIFGLSGRTEVQFSGTTWMLSELYAGSGGPYLGNYSNGTTYFAHNDQVGTRRMYTNVSGAVVQTCYSLPFGDGLSCTGTSTGSPTHFTGQDLDPNTNLTRFPNRNYSTQQGRWMHPDPAGLAAADLINPQTWNRYAYAINNPVSLLDPLGLFCVMTADDGTQSVDNNADKDGCKWAGGQWIDNPTTRVSVSADVNGDTPDVVWEGTGLDGEQIDTTPHPTGQNTWADCVKNSGNYFSLQNGLQTVSDGRLGTGFLSGAVLGNPVSDAVEGIQNAFSGSWSGTGGRTGSIFAGWVTGKGADAASQITNISITTVAATTTVVQAPVGSVSTASVNVTSLTLPTGLLGKGARATAAILEGLNAWNYGVSAVSGMICAIGR